MTERFQGNAGMVKRQKQCAVESHSLVFAAPAPKASQGDFFFLVCPLFIFFFFRTTFIRLLYLFYVFAQSTSKQKGLCSGLLGAAVDITWLCDLSAA